MTIGGSYKSFTYRCRLGVVGHAVLLASEAHAAVRIGGTAAAFRFVEKGRGHVSGIHKEWT